MKGKIILGTGVILLCLVFMASVMVFRSHLLATTRYTELDRAGCINETAMKVYGEGRFRADERQKVTAWIARPVLDTAWILVAILAITALVNITMGIVLNRQESERNRQALPK